ncbi:HAD family hydrolase [Methanobacterium formicicum]|uniref:HAD family hydrolase n=1 Tax=Methanobacterium formicicum TaxID=2162 RepID=UPI00241282BC|nr:HAD family hydrolase [Methanobacterium formicicum]MDG3546987.1 HAD family hydrolase [Methanobacterium formicicum]
MKAVVFDNSGTLISRYRAIKDLDSGRIYDHVSSIDLVDKHPHRALVVLQTDPSTCLINARPDQTIFQFITRNKVPFDISYSSSSLNKKDILTLIKDEKAMISDIQDTIQAVVDKEYNVQICSGSGFIMNTRTGHIEFTITAGGKIFPEVPRVVEELKRRSFHIYVASGDRMKSLEELASFINIPSENVFGTADSKRKREIVSGLKGTYRVMMVGNSANDILALKEADLGVLTTQQEEETPDKVFEAAGVVVSNIKEILDIEF